MVERVTSKRSTADVLMMYPPPMYTAVRMADINSLASDHKTDCSANPSPALPKEPEQQRNEVACWLSSSTVSLLTGFMFQIHQQKLSREVCILLWHSRHDEDLNSCSALSSGTETSQLWQPHCAEQTRIQYHANAPTLVAFSHYSATSTTTTAKTSSHVTRCSDNQRNYCVNGGECFTLEIMPGSTKFLCRCLAGFTGHRCEQAVLKKVSDSKRMCPSEFTGDRCQNYVMASFYKAEELYQKRILTITGICIALLVVGIMCVVAYCKTKKQRKKLHDRLRQNLRKKRKNTNPGIGPNLPSSARGRRISNLPLQDLQLINNCNGTTVQHASETETETNFSTSQSALTAHEPTTFTHISSQSWSNDWSNSVLSDTETVSVMSLAENSQRASQSRRERLNATGGSRDLSAHSKKCRDTPNLDRDLP
ncbi:hypothetical protein FQN60_008502 [Etheostoma spectabile]|uniref:EGF-like domain-containing protein n=1 Tax=Etheostoma spectabile TaxID=54343 RepID=A0A5J5CSH8_9PERO|nr:hypothetical protein FQN60_008502 [Etheostoma spectabile]